MHAPSVTKEQIYSSPRTISVQPIEGMAFNPISEQLYLLAYGSLGQIFILDISQLNSPPILLIDATQFQQLARASGMKAFFHEDSGLQIVVSDHTAWGGYESAPAAEQGKLMIGDADLDGAPDTALIEFLSDEQIIEKHHSMKWRRSWVLP
jgi:hypothetical protein